jgi:segregation and condensation protein A
MPQQYGVHLDTFEGPLDLLLHLIKKSDLDIKDIAIAAITQEYLEYIGLMKEMNLDVAGEFLVMASTLMQIKAKMLLPAGGEDENEGPDPLEDLKAKLLEYQRFKEVGTALSAKEMANADLYYRDNPIVTKEDYVLEASLFDLIERFRKVLVELPGDIKEIVYKEIPIEERIRDILDMLEDKDFLVFDDVLSNETTRRGLIISFLAILELIRLRQIIARQCGQFGEVRIYRVREGDGMQIPLIDNLRGDGSQEPEKFEAPIMPEHDRGVEE